MARSFFAEATLIATFLLAASGRLSAQHSHSHADTAAATSHSSHTSAAPTGGSSEDWKMIAMARHMAYSSPRSLTAPDSVRATHVISELRQAVAKYQNVKVAEADGYKMFAPQIKNQPQYHFTKGWNAIRNQYGFDAGRPTSLLYKKNAQGELVLVGAMYTASKRTSEEDLNERVPLSVAQWHRHVNWCIPPRGQKERWYETKQDRPVFGPLGVATKEECDAADGRFVAQAFGWMLHANLFAGNDLRSIWQDDHMKHDHDAMLGTP